MTRGGEKISVRQIGKNIFGRAERKPTFPKERKSEEERPLSENEARLFFAASFGFSQGSQGLQWEFFQLAHALHPDWQFPDEAVQERMKRDACKQYNARVVHGIHREVMQGFSKIPMDSMEEANRQMENMRIIFETPPSELRTVSSYVHTIFKRMVEKDYEYVVTNPNGRPHTDPKGKYQSYAMDYIAGPHPRSTGIKVFDECFDLLRDYYNQGEWEKDAKLQEKVTMVIKMHRERPRKAFINTLLQKVGIKRKQTPEYRKGV